MGQVGGYLPVTWGMLLVSVSYMRQVDCYLSATWGLLLVSVSYMKQVDVICQLHEAG